MSAEDVSSGLRSAEWRHPHPRAVRENMISSDLRPFPKRVCIENTNACNARCTMCPRESLVRKIEVMDTAAFERILDDSVAAGASKLSLHNFGEPLLDRQLAQKITYAKRSVLYVLVNGDVVPCCYDFNGVLVMGNVFEESIEEIWNGEKFREFRRAHREHRFEKYPICAGCDKLNYILI